MSNLFLDSSALVKRYLRETGTYWLRQQIASATAVIVMRLTRVEVMSAVTRRQREGVIDQRVVQGIDQLLTRHFSQQYTVIPLSEPLVSVAVRLLTAHPLRAYDAVQLAAAVQVNRRLVAQQLTPITFMCADTRLLQIASAEGLTTDDPNNYP